MKIVASFLLAGFALLAQNQTSANQTAKSALDKPTLEAYLRYAELWIPQVTVNIDDPNGEDFESAHKFLLENEIALPTLFDRTGELKAAFNVHDLPQHFLINPEKKIVWQAIGAFKWSDLKARDQLMKLMEAEAVKKEATEEPDPAGSEPDSAE